MGASLFSFADPVVQAFLACAAAILLDWLCGILVAVKSGSFNLGQVARQLVTFWFPFIGGVVIMAIIAAVTERYPGFVQGTGYVALIGSIVAVGAKALLDIFAKLQVLVGSSPAPAPTPAPPAPGP